MRFKIFSMSEKPKRGIFRSVSNGNLFSRVITVEPNCSVINRRCAVFKPSSLKKMYPSANSLDFFQPSSKLSIIFGFSVE